MIVLDVNVVVAAFRDDHPHHPIALSWLARTLDGSEPVVVPDLVWVGFVRVVTSSRIFDPAASLDQAFAFVEAVCSAARYVAVPGLADGLDRFRRAALDADATGNLLPDAYIAAVAYAHGAAVATFDRDFRRFDGLRLVTPAL